MRALAILLVLFAVGSARGSAAAETPAIDPAAAAAVFAERAAICRADGERLWGVDLCGPMAFADPATRTVVTNRPSAAMATVAAGPVYTGSLPAGIAISNTVATIGGERWSLIIWPLPDDPIARRVELMHESWHRVQERLGLPMSNAANTHLATVDGRYWMLLEWRALARALAAHGSARTAALQDALDFREARFAEFAQARADENALLLFEGLAEDTGVALTSAPADRAVRGIEELAAGRARPSLVRSFAYASGPAYGALLDARAPGWRRKLDAKSDLGSLLATAYHIAPNASDAASRAVAYDGATLLASERERAVAAAARAVALRATYVDGPVLRIPLKGASVSFNPSTAVLLEGAGTFFENVATNGWFGKLAAPDGALVSSDFKTVTVPAAAANAQPPYQLTLAPGCTLAADGSNQRITCASP